MNTDSLEVTPLDSALHLYFTRLDNGEAVSRDELYASHPELRDDLATFFASNDVVRKMVGAPCGDAPRAVETRVDARRATVVSLQDAATVAPGAESAANLDAPTFAGPFPLEFGQYRVLRLLGKGAMGEVYLAEDGKLGRRVALKVPQKSVVQNRDHLARFSQEARACAALRHHNICPVYEVSVVDGIHYLSMAYIHGEPLSALIASNRFRSHDEIVHVVRKMALALDCAHRAGVVHRDLKPANVMIDADGEPIVMDFGLARQMGADQSRLTQDGMILGTPAYMSPEQVRSEFDRVGPASDVYSLGAIFYELLTGRLPFTGPLMSILADVVSEQIEPATPSTLRPGIDPRLDAICLRMLAKPIGIRYATMKDVAAALDHYLEAAKSAGKGTSAPFFENTVKSPAPSVSRSEASDPQPLVQRPPGSPRSRAGFGGIAAMGVAALGVAAVIVITVRNRDGSQTRIEVPDGSAVIIATQGEDSAPPKATTPAPAPPAPAPILPAPTPLKPEPALPAYDWPKDAPSPAIAPFDSVQAAKHQSEWARHLGLPVEHTNTIGMKLRLIPPGEYLMGSTPTEIDEALKRIFESREIPMIKSEGPQHRVVLTRPFYLGVFEVTQGEYEKIMDDNPSFFAPTGKGKAAVARSTKTHPVESVLWNEAVEFCRKLSEREKLRPFPDDFHSRPADADEETGYRLPTEAEWEFACRAGTTTPFWIGDAESLPGAAWFGATSSGVTHPVGELRPNPFGLHDVHGNVNEYVWDLWDRDNYQAFQQKPAIDPRGPTFKSTLHSTRGGDWEFHASGCRSAHRLVPAAASRYIGFRVLLTTEGVRTGK